MRTRPLPKESLITVVFPDYTTQFTYFKTYGDFLRLRNDMFVTFLQKGLNNYEFDLYFGKLSKNVRTFLRNAKDYDEYMIRYCFVFPQEPDFVRNVITFIEK